jgi:recombinational DNA repair protein (RecF pathway)
MAITLKFNENSDGGRCVFCGEPVASFGFDFTSGRKIVCHQCAKDRSPDLYRTFEDARAWMEAAVVENSEYARRSGRRSAAEAIFEAVIQDDPSAMAIRACLSEFEKAGPSPDVDEN